MDEEKELKIEEQENVRVEQDLDIKSLKNSIDALCNDLSMLGRALDLISNLEEYRENLYEKYEEYLVLEKRFDELVNKINLDNTKDKIDELKNKELLEKIKMGIEKEKQSIEKIRENFDSFRNAYGAHLEEILKDHNLTLEGKYPEFKISYFTIRVGLDNFDRENYKCIIWYGPKIEKIDECSMVPSKLVKKIEEIINNLGLKKPEDEIFALFKETYLKMSENLKIKEIPIIEFYKEVVKSLKEDLEQSSKGKKKKSLKYSKADFSFDLYRLGRNNYPIKLRIATREFTKRISTHLWIPSDDKRGGSRYSHISILDNGGEVVE